MIRFFVAGVAVLFVVLLLLSWLSRTNPRNVKRSLAALFVILLAFLTLAFVLTGRFALAVPAVIGALTIAMRTWHAWRWWQRLGGLFGASGWQGGGSGQRSQTSSEWLAMQLDHESGRMDGKVLRGAFKGRDLSDLESRELVELHAALSGEDKDGLRLFEAYLERALGDDWRQQLGLEGGPGAAGFGQAMSRDEALRILGLEAGAGEAAVHTAHRELMSKLHPDKGGNDYLAAKINQAKEILLGK
jgi:hypothetical protein